MNVVVARHWGAAARGELASGTVLATVAASVGGMGMHDVVVWATRREATSLVAEWIRASVMTTACAGILATLIARFAFHLDWDLAASIGLMCPAMQIIRIQCSTLLAAGRLLAFDIARLASLGLSCVALLIFAVVNSYIHPLWIYLLGQFAALLVIATAGDGLSWRGRPRWPKGAALRLGAMSSAGGLLTTSLLRIDILFVALILNQANAGIYALALAAAEAILFGATGLSYHALRAGSANQRDSHLLARAIAWTSSLAVVGYACLHFLAGDVLGRQFQAIDTTFLLLTPGTVAISAVRIRWAFSIGGGRAGRASSGMVAGILLQTVLDLALVPHLGVNGAAIASSLGYGAAAVAIFGPTVRRRPTARSDEAADERTSHEQSLPSGPISVP